MSENPKRQYRRRVLLEDDSYISFESGQGGGGNSPYVVVWVRIRMPFKYHHNDDLPESRPKNESP
jgi:hypothetical protein